MSTAFAFVLYACKKTEQLPSETTDRSIPQSQSAKKIDASTSSTNREGDEILNLIQETEDYRNYVQNFQNELGDLDFSTAAYTHTEEGSYVTISSNQFVGESRVPKAQFQFSYDDSTLGIGIVINHSRASVTPDAQFIEGYYSINFPNGWELCKIIKHTDGTKEVQDGEDIEAIDNFINGSTTARTAVSTPCYYGYVRYCYNTGKAACERDPDCSFYCDFLPCNSIRLMDCSLKGLKHCRIIGHA